MDLAYFTYTIVQLASHWATLDWYNILIQFLFPIWLTLSAAASIYLISLYAGQDRGGNLHPT